MSENKVSYTSIGLHEWEKKRAIYYLNIAKIVSKNTKCLSRKIGSVLVKNDTVIATGYNGPSRNVKHCNERTADFYNELDNHSLSHISSMDKDTCPRRIFGYSSGQGLHLCQAVHSERNAILSAAFYGISTAGTTLYCYCGVPCKDCMMELINAGVEEIFCLREDKDYDKYSRTLAEEAGINIVEIDKGLLE